MKVSVVGSGYVGVVSAAGFAEKGHDVVCVDIDEAKVKSINDRKPPIYEDGLAEILESVVPARLNASTDLKSAVLDSEVTFICVGTPSQDNGEIDLSQVEAVATEVGKILKDKSEYHVVVVKSTVATGSTDNVVIPLLEKNSGKKAGKDFGVCMNPEFLREGVAVDDFLNPDRIVIGSIDQRAGDVVANLYFEFTSPVLRTNIKTAEMIKYASNSLLATKISFINEIGNVCKKLGVDVYDVAKGVGLDHRISPSFLRAGPGFGGSCFAAGESTFTLNSPNLVVNSFEKLFDSHESDVSQCGFEAYTLSYNLEERRPVFARINCITKRRYNGFFIELESTMGRVMKVTEDHPLIVYNEQKDVFEIKLAGDVRVKDQLPIALGLPQLMEVTEINILDHLAESGLEEKIKLRCKGGYFREKYETFRPHIPAKTHANKYDFKRRNYLPYTVYKELKQLNHLPDLDEEKLRLFTTKGSPTYAPAVFKVNDDFMRLIGYYIAEGFIGVDYGRNNVDRERVGFCFGAHELEYTRDVKKILESLGIKYITSEKGGSHSIIVSSKILAFLLRDVLGCGVSSYEKKLPKIAFNVDEQLRLSLLRGLFSGDGSVTPLNKGKHFMFEYATVSKSLADGIILLLQSLNIVPTVRKRWMNKSKVPAYIVRVNGVSQLEKLKTVFGVEKQRQIEERISKYKRRISLSGVKLFDGFGALRVTNIRKYRSDEYVYSMETENGLLVGSSGLLAHNCFPKDVSALVSQAEDAGVEPILLNAVLSVNKSQPMKVVELVKNKIDLPGKKIAVLGLAFKAGTDDMRESPAIPIVNALLSEGAEVCAYDPEAAENAKEIFKGEISYADSPQSALSGADAALVVTDWPEFEKLDFSGMKTKIIFDSRKIIKQDLLSDDVEYEGLCW